MTKTKSDQAQTAALAPVSTENPRADGVVRELTPEEDEAQTGAAGDDEQASALPAVHLVQMVRDPNEYPAPHAADVHPDEVENYRAGGWLPA